MKLVMLITGAPGVGKTTVLTKTVDILRKKGFTVGGMLSREVRENGVRVGFEITDISSEKHGWLAHVNQQTGPQVGKYRVNIVDLDDVGAKAVINAIENCDIVVIDEIGPMELFSKRFKDAVNAALQSQKAVMAVVHARARDILISEVKARKDAEIFEVTHQNRDHLPEAIAEKTLPKPFKNPN